MKRITTILSVLLIAAFALAACAPAATPTQAPKPTAMPAPTATTEPMDIVDIAVADGRFKTLAAALTAAGLVDTLKGAGPFTVFAPTDEAFAKLPAGTIDELLKPENKQKLTDILLYHVVSGKVMAADVVKLTSATTVLGKDVMVKVDMGNVYINESKVVITDIATSNGIIHVIDSILLPPAEKANTIVDVAVADGRFKTLAAALGAAGLVETLQGAGPFTVFAPTDEAFAKLPAGTIDELLKPENKQKLTDILLYHVVSGKVMAADVTSLTSATTVLGKDVTVKVDMGSVYINDAKVIITDIEASNGVIHVIDSVLLPPAEGAMMDKTIVDVAVADGRFKTLVAALGAAGLVETLQGAGPFTVFAPTDEAFAKLPAGTIDTLLKPENKQKLTDILLYHVVSGKVMAADVVTLTSAPTVLGKDVTITVKDGKVFLNDTVQVIITDIETSNGVIHVIDAVLLPPQ
jgi:transforming growth factor-beta-induced protein